jgi:inner membrane protein
LKKWEIDLPTVITHSVIAASAAYSFGSKKELWKLLILGMVCSMLPDADVIGYHYFYIPYHHFLGHRGFFHSLFFAALLSLLVVFLFFRKAKPFSGQWWQYVLYFFVLTGSHGLLDALTNGGNGIALFSPFYNDRFFFPWTPIQVSPLSIKGFLSMRGLKVMMFEALWIWLPCLMVVFFLKIRRKRRQISESR